MTENEAVEQLKDEFEKELDRAIAAKIELFELGVRLWRFEELLGGMLFMIGVEAKVVEFRGLAVEGNPGAALRLSMLEGS